VRCQVIAATGWTWEEVGRLTLPRLRALYRHWRRHPPVHLLLAAKWGLVPQDDKPVQASAHNTTADDALPAWLQGMKPLPSPAGGQAVSNEEALGLFQRQFFGDVHVFR